MKNEVYLDFTIAGFDDITHDEISQQLGVDPKHIYVKGAKEISEIVCFDFRQKKSLDYGIAFR